MCFSVMSQHGEQTCIAACFEKFTISKAYLPVLRGGFSTVSLWTPPGFPCRQGWTLLLLFRAVSPCHAEKWHRSVLHRFTPSLLTVFHLSQGFTLW